jgi:mannosyl-oligosaccharide alpha-1,2-mannosidase
MKFVLLGIFLAGLAAAVPTTRDTCKQVQYAFPADAGNATRAQAVADAYRRVFGEYEKYCFGDDALQPISKTCDTDSLWHFCGTIIDGLDTAIIMNLTDIMAKGLANTAAVNFSLV